jgi:FkbM family methyltransferase
LTSGRAHVVGFEPNPKALGKLNAVKGAHETYLPYAIADGQRHTLHVCALQGMTSLLKPNPRVLSLFYGFERWGQVVQTLDVDTMRLDDVPETEGVDLLKIDIQGAELMAFKNAPERLKSALLIHTEVEFLEMYQGQPLFSEVEQFLRASGFVLHRFEPLVSRDFAPMLLSYNQHTHHSQLFWADAIFVKDFTKLDLISSDQLLRLAEILYDCYGSLDFVLLLLREHDQRTGGDFGQKFFNMVRLLVSATELPKLDQ